MAGLKKTPYMLEKTSDTVLALLAKSRNVFGLELQITTQRGEKGRLSSAISMTFKAKTYKYKQFVHSKFWGLN